MNILAKSRHAWCRAVIVDDDLEPAARIVGLALASLASTRSNQLILAVRPDLRARLALTAEEAAQGVLDLVTRGYLTLLPELRCEPGDRAVLSFPPGKAPRDRDRDAGRKWVSA